MSYVDERFYDSLVADFTGWDAGEALADRDTVLAAGALLALEARLLDQARFEDWLQLFSAECLYWIPATWPAGDPRREVAVAFDDRRRLEDRVFRLRTGAAWSQAPASRTARTVSNVEAFESGERLMVRASMHVAEMRAGERRIWSGWSAYRLRRGNGNAWMIDVKQVNLIDCDQNLRNPSLLL